MKFIDAFLSGLASARPSAASLANGVFYFSTDTGELARVDAAAWVTYLSVGGDVVGPAGATDGAPALFDGATGKLLKVGSLYVVGPGAVTDGAAALFDGTSGNLLKEGSPPGGSGALTFIEDLTVGGSAVSDITFSATLDGDTDGQYIIQGSVSDPNVGLGTELRLQPNAVTSNQSSRWQGNINDVGAVGATASSSMVLGIHMNVSGVTFFNAIFRAKTGKMRSCISQMGYVGATRSGFVAGGGGWTDTSTNVTSIKIASSAANGIGAGSNFKLYKRQDT